MSTYSWSSVLAQETDAEFRAWGSELNAALAAVGLVQTADSGQIDWTTVTRAGSYTAAGYEIWRTADSSLYYKVEYGSGGSSNQPNLWLTVGTGSSGAGALTGQSNTWTPLTAGIPPYSTTTAYMSYVSASNNHLTLVWKVNAYADTSPAGFVVVGKTVDSSGAATTTGYAVVQAVSNLTAVGMQSVRTAATAQTRAQQTDSWAAVPGKPASSLVGADVQAYTIWMDMPQVMPFAWASLCLRSEFTPWTTVTFAPVGGTSHTYLACGSLIWPGGTINNLSASTYSLLVCYE